MHRYDIYTYSPSLSSMFFLNCSFPVFRHLQANSLENDVLLLEARPFAMELQKLTSQTLTKLEPTSLAKTSSCMGYLAVIDSMTSEVGMGLIAMGVGIHRLLLVLLGLLVEDLCI